PERLPVYADPTRIVQALGNLLGNAVKFTGAGGKVTVELRAEGDRAALSVQDNGAGIPPALLPHLFAPFWQAPQLVDRPRGGLGLGLAMVKGLVELHGGTVRAASEGPGRGAVFTIILPRDDRSRAESATTGTVLPRGAPQPCRVLVIEDNIDAADTLRDALTVAGHEARAAYDGPSGLEKAREFRPDVVICDIGLPGMSGYDVARAIRDDQSLGGQTYLMALSGYGSPEDVRRALEAGFQRHVVKPPDLDALEHLIAESRAPASADGARI
ncbi:MAG: response regulator, partial [Myxococcales bacterium]|nr:response regulator [Myxococcales bacterium]